MPLDPRKLIHFATVVEFGSIRRASRALSLSQPALSISMDRLEKSAGVRLLERSTTGILPTIAGQALYRHACLVRDGVAEAERRFRAEEAPKPSPVRFGSLPSLVGGVLPIALGRWRDAFPDQRLHIVENTQQELLIGLLKGEIDVFVGRTECYDMVDGLRQRVLFRDQLKVLAQAGHPLLDAPTLSWADLVRYPWVSSVGGRYQSLLEGILREEGLELPRRMTTCASFSVMRALVSGSGHLALMPAHAVGWDLTEGRLHSLPVAHRAFDRNIAVYFRDGETLGEASRALVACVERVGLELNSRARPWPARASA